MRLHNNELKVSKKNAGGLIKLMKKNGVALPLNSIRARAKPSKK